MAMGKPQIDVEKQQGESTSALVRRFSKSVQQSGVVKKAKSLKHYERPLSEKIKRDRALKRLERKRRKERLRKLGKI